MSCLRKWVVKGVCFQAAGPTSWWWSGLCVSLWAIGFCLHCHQEHLGAQPCSVSVLRATLRLCTGAIPAAAERQGGKQQNHSQAWRLARLCICSPKSEHSVHIWKLFQGQIFIASITHERAIQVSIVVRVSWISDLTALPFFFIQLWKTSLQVVFLLWIWVRLQSDIPKWGNHLWSYSWLMLAFLSRLTITPYSSHFFLSLSLEKCSL